MAEGCSDTSVETIGIFLKTKLKAILVGFDGGLSNKSIPIGDAETEIYLPNSTIISQMNDTPLFHRYSKFLISTP